ncbi:UNVERIFIED_CONTAM: hypothetical protein Slati_0479400 [Sesamum latifolium]|uniref:Reverse transcriptase n=1 Tax=Sesamum latifolium TaxID=2727402 RepID=A0AAW2XZP6_9LAMI
MPITIPGLIRYVETIRGGDRYFRLRIRRGPNTMAALFIGLMVKTDNTAVSYFMSRQARWQCSSSAVATSIRDRMREFLPKDPAVQGLVHLVEQGKALQFWLEDGLLMTKENRLYVPKGGDLRKSLISECHDTLWAGHLGENRTYALDKEDPQKKAGLLKPLPIPKRPWESVSIDYIPRLPKVGDLGSIIIVVD